MTYRDIAVAGALGPLMNAARAAAGLVSLLAAIELVEFFAGAAVLNLEAVLVAPPGEFGAVPLARMSPLTAVTFLGAGLALVLLARSSTTAARDTVGILGGLVALAGATVVLGYLYGAPLLYGGRIIPMALTTALAFMGTGKPVDFAQFVTAAQQLGLYWLVLNEAPPPALGGAR